MPLPKPSGSENESDFIGRCMSDPVMEREFPDRDRRLGVCYSQWRGKAVNEQLLKAIQARLKGRKKTEFGYGIITADRYVRTMAEGIGQEACKRFAVPSGSSLESLLEKSAQTLVYSNPDMMLEEKGVVSKEIGVDLPKNTLMVFKHVLTSSRKDRDGDVLRSDGAVLDPKMLLLWQHVHSLPIGKLLKVSDKTSDKLSVYSAIVDMNEVSHDAAVMVDNDMARFSHGFRAIDFEEIKSPVYPQGGEVNGFDVKTYEVMEESMVSVPANVDSETEEVLLSLVEGGKLTSGLMKQYGKRIREKRPLALSGVEIKYKEGLGDFSREVVCGSFEDLKKAYDNGLIGDKESGCEDESSTGSDETKGAGKEKDGADPSEEANDGEGRKEGEASHEEVKPKEKQGRTLSKDNENKIRDARDDVDEARKMDIARPCKALLKSASDSLGSVLKSLKEEPKEKPSKSEEESISVSEAMAVVLTKATPEQRKTLLASLQALADSEERSEKAECFRALVGLR